jgi:simple sugar transport system permease protein
MYYLYQPGILEKVKNLNSILNYLKDNYLPVPGVLMPFLAAAAALLIGSITLLILGANPITAFSAMINSVFANSNTVADSLVKAPSLLFVEVGICMVFRGSVPNIGGEGRLVADALAASTVALIFPD